MAIIVIKDLQESVELDRQAMTAITGGARYRARQPQPAQSILRSTRIVNYPPGFPRSAATGNLPRK
ncbi:hypothetical protein GCM10027343_07720 [Noviherbaspirillum agri]